MVPTARLLYLVVQVAIALLAFTSCNAFPLPPARFVKRRARSCLHSAATPPRLADQPDNELEECPPGYYLDSVHKSCNPLGPLGKVSQIVELTGPFRTIYKKITALFGVDPKRLGVAFALSYSVISNINGSISLSIAWYMSCVRVSGSCCD